MTTSTPSWQTLPLVSRATLTADLRRLGLQPGATVLVHSSLSRIGQVEGGAETVIDALIDSVAPGGTVLFPTLTGDDCDGPACPPMMDIRATPCWTGRIPETARSRSGGRRSLHPTHSVVAIGPAVERYTAGHERSMTPCDEHSPYYRLIADDGYILLLGATHDSNTTLHCLEELAKVPYHLQPDPTTCLVVDADGRHYHVHNRLHLWRWERDFPKIDAPLLMAGAQVDGLVGSAPSRLIQARQMADLLLPELQRQPLYLLSQAAREMFVADQPA